MKALVLGGGAGVWDEVAQAEALFGPGWWDIAIAANDIGCHWPHRLDAWCSLHPEKLPGWVEAREANGHPPAREVVVRRGRAPKVPHRMIRHPFGNGSSGLLAVAVAMDLGATRIVLCGIPMTRTPYFAESDVHEAGSIWSGATAHWKKWQSHGAELDGIVRSMSGRTREFLGAPTREWLEEADGEQAA